MKKGWEEKTVGDCCLKTKNHKWTDRSAETYQYIDLSSVCRESLLISSSDSISEANAPSRAKKIIEHGDVIFATTRPTLRRVAIVTSGYDSQICSTGFTVLRPAIEKLNTSYLYYYIQTKFFMDRMEELQRGASYPAVSDSDVKSSEIPIPPLSEQEAIVEVLDKVFIAIDQAKANIEQNIANAKELFQSKLNQIFSQKGEGWVVKPLDQISTIINGYSFKSGDFSSSIGVKSIKITNVGVQEFVEDDSNNLPASFSDEHRSVCVYSGNLVLALTRTIISSGLKVALIPETYDGALLNQRVAAIIPNKDVIDCNFLYYYFSSNIVSDYVLENVNTLMQPNLSIKDLKRMPIPICSMEQQQSMKSIIEKLDERTTSCLEAYQTKLASLEELKKSILQKAFAGELTSVGL